MGSLDRLLDKTLPDSDAAMRRRRSTQAQRKAKAAKAAKSKALKAAVDPSHTKRDRARKLARNLSSLESWQHEEELHELKEKILDKKRGSSESVSHETTSSKAVNYPGLTPGLAPVGLDESDSEDD